MIYPNPRALRNANASSSSIGQKLRKSRKAIRRIIGLCMEPDHTTNLRAKIVETATKSLKETA